MRERAQDSKPRTYLPEHRRKSLVRGLPLSDATLRLLGDYFCRLLRRLEIKSGNLPIWFDGLDLSVNGDEAFDTVACSLPGRRNKTRLSQLTCL